MWNLKTPLIALGALLASLAAMADDGQKTLLLFWRADCAPCRRELEILPAIAAAHSDMQIAIMALQSEPNGLPANVRVINVENAEAALASFGNKKRALPFSVALHADGSVCARHYGILGEERAASWANRC